MSAEPPVKKVRQSFMQQFMSATPYAVSDTVDVIRGSSGQQWRVVKVKSDGNCLYGSLAMQLNRHDQTERSAATVRSEIVDFIRQHPNVVLDSGAMTQHQLQLYLEKQSTDGCWGDGIILAAAVRCYHHPILVVSDSGHEQTIDTSLASTAEPLTVGYINNNHYVSLLKEDATVSPSSEPSKEPVLDKSDPHPLSDAPEIQSESGKFEHDRCSAASAQVEPPMVPDVVLMKDISEGVAAMKLKTNNISDEQKAYFIKNRVPDKSFQFPAKQYKDKRRPSGFMSRYCCLEWFDKFDFLGYSVAMDGLFCLPCVLFPVPSHRGNRANVLITSPYQNWKDAKTDLTNHATLQYHLDSKEKMDAFVQTMQKPQRRVDQILSQDAMQTVNRNRKFLESIIRCLELCGRQGIALRGHRDDGNPMEEKEKDTNVGNFKALIGLVSRTDEDLKKHLETCPKTATYMSKTTQNDLFQCIAEFMQQKIVEDVKGQEAGSYFGVIADEVTDSSNWEQLGIVVRYVKDNMPVERLLEYVKCEGITGEEIALEIINCLSNVGLDTDKCRCQTYDGAGNMAGKERGAANQFRLKTGNMKATYFHCASHELNLALSKASKVPEIYNMVCVMQTVGIFFKYSPKRQRALEHSIEDECKKNNKNPNTAKTKVKPLCETRWVERHTAFSDLEAVYKPLLNCLDCIAVNEDNKWDPKTVTEATGLKKQLQSSNFIVAFVICHHIFGFSKGLSRQLQGASLDIITAYERVELITEELKNIRNDDVAEFSKMFAVCDKMAQDADKPLSKPRVVGRQTLRSNVEAQNVEEYFRRSIFLPFLDNLISQLEDRFTGRSQDAIKALYLLPKNLGKIDNDIVEKILSCYESDLPSSSVDFKQELRLWQRYWSARGQNQKMPSTVSDTLQHINAQGIQLLYPNITSIFGILLTFSATSASVERSNSALRFIKTSYRSTMGEERFNALALLFVHRDIALDYEKIIDRYAQKFPRRMLFRNPLMESDS